MFQMDKEFVQQLLNYLAGRPYAEVYQMVEVIRSLKEVSASKPDFTDKDVIDVFKSDTQKVA